MRALLACLCLSGCATNLVIAERPSQGPWTGGIPVNQRAAFVATVVANPALSDLPSQSTSRVDGVHPLRVLSVDIRRQIFADGKVQLELDAEQRLKQVTITSDSGAANGLATASEVIDAVQPAKGKK
jgi:hypothetical protein